MHIFLIVMKIYPIRDILSEHIYQRDLVDLDHEIVQIDLYEYDEILNIVMNDFVFLNMK